MHSTPAVDIHQIKSKRDITNQLIDYPLKFSDSGETLQGDLQIMND